MTSQSAEPVTSVSVIVPAYNEERWLAECLESLRAQTHPRFELVVVDDGSTDATASIARRYGVRSFTTAHQGAGAARDEGARVVRGEVLVFLDADEIYAPDFLERLVAPLADPAVSGTFPGGVEWHNPEQGLAAGWLEVRGARAAARPRYGPTHPWPKALRRAEFELKGGYPRVGYGEDRVFGKAFPPALVVPEARWRYTLPISTREVFGKARWIARGTHFDRRPWKALMSLPPCSGLRALGWLVRGKQRAAWVRLVYDLGLLVGFAEGRLRPGLRPLA